MSLGAVHFGKKARVKGNVRAVAFSMEAGATLVGDVTVGPDEVPELRRLQEARAAASVSTGPRIP